MVKAHPVLIQLERVSAGFERLVESSGQEKSDQESNSGVWSYLGALLFSNDEQ